jgi:hypothetical protein
MAEAGSRSRDPTRSRAMLESRAPYRPIAVGFHLLAVPLVLAVFLEATTFGRIANAVAAAVMIGLGGLMWGKRA